MAEAWAPDLAAVPYGAGGEAAFTGQAHAMVCTAAQARAAAEVAAEAARAQAEAAAARDAHAAQAAQAARARGHAAEEWDAG